MNISLRFKSTFAGLLATLSVLGLAAVLPGTARATTLYSSPVILGTQTASNYGSNYYVEDSTESSPAGFANTQVSLGLFSFGDTDISSLVGLQITLSLQALGTSTAPNYGQIDLTLDGIDTGIQLNGFTGGNSTQTVTGLVNANNAATILSDIQTGIATTFNLPQYLTTSSTDYTGINSKESIVGGAVYYTNTQNGTSPVIDPSAISYGDTPTDGDPADDAYIPTLAAVAPGAGQVVVGLALVGNDSTSPGSPHEFQLTGGSATLELADTAIPFSPSQSIGFGLIALFIALWYIPQTSDLMKRMLVPSRA